MISHKVFNEPCNVILELWILRPHVKITNTSYSHIENNVYAPVNSFYIDLADAIQPTIGITIESLCN